MARTQGQNKGIFCLETYKWYGSKDESSVEPILELLHKSHKRVPYTRRDVATLEEFTYFLNDYLRPGYHNYPILHLSFHGDDDPPGIILDDKSRKVSLDELEELIDGRCKDRIIYFGSCSTMNEHGRRLSSFRRRTGALAVCGFRQAVGWLTSAAFETLVLSGLQDVRFTKRGIERFDKTLKDEAPGLYRKLGFRLVV